MRWSFSFIFILFFVAAQSQEIKVNLHTHSWAGGICCRYGVQYNYTIKIPKGDWSHFDSLRVCNEGRPVRYSRQQLNPTPVGDTIVFTLQFGYTYDESKKELMPEKVSRPCTGEDLVLVKGLLRKSLAVTRRTESMVAYP